jgi:hypothetical protein
MEEKYPLPVPPGSVRRGRGLEGGILICRNSEASKLNVRNRSLLRRKASGGCRGRGWNVGVEVVKEYRIPAERV